MSLPSEIFVFENNQLIMLKMRMNARVMVTARMYGNEDKGKGKNIDNNYDCDTDITQNVKTGVLFCANQQHRQ